jgi:ATP-dependent helicase/nuclease subunit B
MQVRFVVGPAGSGKTFRCLEEARAALAAAPEGLPLLLVAPKQTTFELERQLLASPDVAGYTRLRIFSFERLAHFIFEQLGRPAPHLLSEEGRLMVLRGLLARKRDALKLFRASARLTGFAQHLSRTLRELQRHQLTPESLNKLAGELHGLPGLSLKLQDLAMLLRDYLDWLNQHSLQDADCLLDSVRRALLENAVEPQRSTFQIGALWVDGFVELSPQELDLLAGLVQRCEQATFTFCLDHAPTAKISWLSHWAVVRRTLEECRRRIGELDGVNVKVELLPRHPAKSRFTDSRQLQHLEQFWAEPRPFAENAEPNRDATRDLENSVRVITCQHPEAEATAAAREILRHVHNGGRYRDVTVLARRLDAYSGPLQRVFTRYGIPCFLDRRESVSHHPLAELTRSALRTVAFQWARDDWFAALKTGLAPASDEDIDALENEALARGWKGDIWQTPIHIPNEPELSTWAEKLRKKIVLPFQTLALQLAAQQNRPAGPQLAGAVREFWRVLRVEERLQAWAAAAVPGLESRVPGSVHLTVWEQMNAWLDNVELAFPSGVAGLPLREWLPILDAGLASLTVGVIPPALDQVLVGVVDRLRNPDVKLALVLGLNEGVFPALPEASALLTDADRADLESRNIILASAWRQQLGRERHYGYIACTRARQRLVLTYSLGDEQPLNASPFLSHLRQLFPALEFETAPRAPDWREAEHVSELIAPLMRMASSKPNAQNLTELLQLPALALVAQRLRDFRNPDPADHLSSEMAEKLYGATLHTSVSRLEQFAACPFRFFVHSGLRAEERKLFELDAREQGSFQHDALALFHDELHRENKRWRDLTPAEARERIGRIAQALLVTYRDGLLEASAETRFTARVLTESLQDFVETLVAWMRGQYQFDPAAVELAFGEEGGAPAWEVDLGNGQGLSLHGRIDRVDLCRDDESGAAYCVVIDYKSSEKKLDAVLIENGLQLQLLAYLNALRHWPASGATFGAARLVPAGVFYVNLRGKYGRDASRLEVLAGVDAARKLAYQHRGRFDGRMLRKLDGRPGISQGDQFNFRLTNTGAIHASSRDAVDAGKFAALLDMVESNLVQMGRDIFSGMVRIDPYRKGAVVACDQCSFHAICRIDPWTHRYRVLKTRREDDSTGE